MNRKIIIWAISGLILLVIRTGIDGLSQYDSGWTTVFSISCVGCIGLVIAMFVALMLSGKSVDDIERKNIANKIYTRDARCNTLEDVVMIVAQEGATHYTKEGFPDSELTFYRIIDHQNEKRVALFHFDSFEYWDGDGTWKKCDVIPNNASPLSWLRPLYTLKR